VAIIAYPSAVFTTLTDQQTHITHSYKVRFHELNVSVASASTFQISSNFYFTNWNGMNQSFPCSHVDMGLSNMAQSYFIS
jgi:hypothetical protein